MLFFIELANHHGSRGFSCFVHQYQEGFPCEFRDMGATIHAFEELTSAYCNCSNFQNFHIIIAKL